MTDVLLFVLLVIIALPVVLLSYSLYRLSRTAEYPQDYGDWLESLTVDRYLPMLYLLNEGDMEFRRAQPGAGTAMIQRRRDERIRVFREYLNCLESDFGRVCMLLRLMITASQNDRPDLARSLHRQEFRFARLMLSTRIRVLLYRLGGCPVDVSELVRAFDGLRMELAGAVASV